VAARRPDTGTWPPCWSWTTSRWSARSSSCG